jgi:spore germination protein KC
MMRRTGMSLIVVLLSIAMAGCWSRHELNDLAITLAVGLDKAGNQYRVSAQIVNPGEVAAKKGSGGKGAPVVTYFATGETVFEAIRKLTTKSPRKLYFSHMRMLIISEQLAKEGIGRTLDSLSRDHEFRTDFFIAVAKGSTAEKVLEIYTVPQEIIPANKMFKSIQNSSRYWAVSGKITIDDLISDLVSKGKEAVVTGVDLTGDITDERTGTVENVNSIKPISSIHISGLAVFRKDKLVGWLNEEESKAYNYMQDEVKSTVGYVSCPRGGKLALEVIRTKAKMKGKFIDGKPEVNVNLQLENNVADVECDIDLTSTETISKLEKIAEKKVKDGLVKTITKAQKKLKSDLFGFGEALHRSDPKEWKKIESNWEREFADLPVNVTVDVKIRRLGTVTESFMKKVKE